MAAQCVRLLLIGSVCGVFPHAALAQSADPLEGLVVREIRVTGLRHLSSDVVEGHLATRNAAGLFDVSHMGVYDVRGADAASFLDAVCGNDCGGLLPGESLYVQADISDQAQGHRGPSIPWRVQPRAWSSPLVSADRLGRGAPGAYSSLV